MTDPAPDSSRRAPHGRSGKVWSRLNIVREIASLHERVSELEAEIQECRRLNRRLAELTDVVQELLIPLADRDQDKVREQLARYSSSL